MLPETSVDAAPNVHLHHSRSCWANSIVDGNFTGLFGYSPHSTRHLDPVHVKQSVLSALGIG